MLSRRQTCDHRKCQSKATGISKRGMNMTTNEEREEAKRTIVYEWDIESTDDDGEVGHNHFNHCPGIPTDSDSCLVLIYNYGSVDDGMIDKAWAYVKDGKLDEWFRDAYGSQFRKVPARFQRELARVRSGRRL
jgi:hypothetical protein